jgi:hypothetical protein
VKLMLRGCHMIGLNTKDKLETMEQTRSNPTLTEMTILLMETRKMESLRSEVDFSLRI